MNDLLPDFGLIFINDENKDIFRIGYYNDVMNLELKGFYLDVNEDIMYKVELQLLIY